MKELLFNKTGDIYLTPEQLIDRYRKSCKEIIEIGHIRFLEAQYELYKNFILRVMKTDIDKHPEQDPFFLVTGFPFKKVYLEKHLNCTSNMHLLCSPTTDFLSAEHLLNWKLDPNKSAHIDDRCMRITGEVLGRYRMIGWVNLHSKKNWHINFAPLDFSIYPHKEQYKLHLLKSVIFLEPEPLGHLRQYQNFDEIYKILLSVGTLFNHDLPGHGTIDLTGIETIEGNIFRNLTDEEYKYNYEHFYCRKDMSVLEGISFEERRLLSLHHKLSAVIREKSLLDKVLDRQLGRYIYLLGLSRTQGCITDDEYHYFVRVYLFCMIRIITFNETEKICRKYSCIYDFIAILEINETESEVQRYLQVAEGAPYLHLKSKDWWELRFIPHEQFFEDIVTRVFV